MSQLSEFLHMGGYAGYVWSAYGIAFAVLLWNIFVARARQRDIERHIRRRIEQDQS